MEKKKYSNQKKSGKFYISCQNRIYNTNNTKDISFVYHDIRRIIVDLTYINNIKSENISDLLLIYYLIK